MPEYPDQADYCGGNQNMPFLQKAGQQVTAPTSLFQSAAEEKLPGKNGEENWNSAVCIRQAETTEIEKLYRKQKRFPENLRQRIESGGYYNR